MGYVLELISPEDQKKILDDAGERKRGMLLHREHFVMNATSGWAVDREHNFYLLNAPGVPKSSDLHYYFHFHGVMYGFHIRLGYPKVVHFDDPVPSELLAEIKKEIKAAFAVLGMYGFLDKKTSLDPEFPGEGA